MAHLKYYFDEENRHPGPRAVALSPREGIALVGRLCGLNSVKPIKVVIYRGRGKSTFRERKKGCYIKLDETHLTALVVIHEVAHYLNWRDWVANGRPGRRPGHSRVHKVAVNHMVDQVIANRLLPPRHMKKWREAEEFHRKHGGKSKLSSILGEIAAASRSRDLACGDRGSA